MLLELGEVVAVPVEGDEVEMAVAAFGEEVFEVGDPHGALGTAGDAVGDGGGADLGFAFEGHHVFRIPIRCGLGARIHTSILNRYIRLVDIQKMRGAGCVGGKGTCAFETVHHGDVVETGGGAAGLGGPIVSPAGFGTGACEALEKLDIVVWEAAFA